eukprot:jgi/Undpi1/1978/HiC_scaffold_12.g05365.m1
MGCKKIFAILLASLLFAALVSVAPGTQRVVSDNSSGVADKKWTTQDLVQMGKSKAMAAAVSYMASDALQPGAKTLKLDGIKELIDTTSAAEIRSAMLMATTTGLLKTRRVKAMDKKIADFAATVNPAATCAAADTAGGNGRDACVLDCQHNRIFPAWPRRKGACYALCTLATAPCTADILQKSWVTIVMEKGSTAIKNACATLSVKTAVAFLVLVMAVFSLYAARVTYWLAKKRAGLRILEGIISRRKKSAMAPRFAVWKEAAAALTIEPPD